MSDTLPGFGGSTMDDMGGAFEPLFFAPGWRPPGRPPRSLVPPLPEEQTCPRGKPIENAYCGEPRCAIHKRGGARDKLFGPDATTSEVRLRIEKRRQSATESFPERGTRPRWKQMQADAEEQLRQLLLKDIAEFEAEDDPIRIPRAQRPKKPSKPSKQKLAPIPKPEPVFVEPVTARAPIPDAHEEV